MGVAPGSNQQIKQEILANEEVSTAAQFDTAVGGVS